MAKNLSIMERLLAHIEPDPNSGCWLWSRAENGMGYGVIRIDHKNHLTHRLSWTLHRGSIPPRLCVLHRCDTPACCNPDHLFLGTKSDNMADMIAKKRDRKALGEKASKAKLTAVDVLAIRASDEWPRFLAARYGVSRHSIWLIQARRSWRHI